MSEESNHIGVVSDGADGYLITAEYVSGYEVLAAFAILSEAKAALPKAKRDYLARLKARDLQAYWMERNWI